jgi:hypothetical protein
MNWNVLQIHLWFQIKRSYPWFSLKGTSNCVFKRNLFHGVSKLSIITQIKMLIPDKDL